MTSATMQDIENTVNKINTVLKHDTWNIKTAFIALQEQLEKFDNVFESFDSIEDQSILEGFCFLIEGENLDREFHIYQCYEDIKKLTLEY